MHAAEQQQGAPDGAAARPQGARTLRSSASARQALSWSALLEPRASSASNSAAAASSGCGLPSSASMLTERGGAPVGCSCTGCNSSESAGATSSCRRRRRTTTTTCTGRASRSPPSLRFSLRCAAPACLGEAEANSSTSTGSQRLAARSVCSQSFGFAGWPPSRAACAMVRAPRSSSRSPPADARGSR